MKYLTPAELAIELKVHPRTVMRWRHTGIGPAYIRTGRHNILYQDRDVATWLATQTFVSPKAEKSPEAKSSAIIKRPRRPNEALRPLTGTVDDVRRLTGLGTTKIYELISQQKLKTVCVSDGDGWFFSTVSRTSCVRQKNPC